MIGEVYGTTGEMGATGGIYIVCLILALLLGISISIFGILLRKKMRIEFVYLMVAGGLVIDFVVLLLGFVSGII